VIKISVAYIYNTQKHSGTTIKVYSQGLVKCDGHTARVVSIHTSSLTTLHSFQFLLTLIVCRRRTLTTPCP